jgi:carbon monoxide dehydrogenase subunit G
MAFEISQSFTLNAPIADVWEFLVDPERVAGCLPGAAITGKEGEDSYTGTMKVKVGPVASSYKGKVQFTNLDRESWTADLKASGQDVKGKGGADMTMTSRLTEQPGGQTEVSVTSQVNITGILAQLGRGMIQEVSDQMFRQFSAGMKAELEQDAAPATPEVEAQPEKPGSPAPQSAAPAAPAALAAPAADVLDVGALGASAGKAVLGRMLTKPGFWVVVAVVVAVLYWLIGR